MRICFVSSEIAPLAKAGGLADVSASLTRYLNGAGHDVRVFLPLYRRIDTKNLDLIPVEFMHGTPIALGGRTFSFSLFTTKLPGSDLMIYLVHCPALYDRPELYTNDADEHLRFILLSRAAMESCQRMGWSPQIIHCNDWQTSMMPLYLRSAYQWDQLFQETRTVLTIHNIGYQGVFSSGIVDDLGLSEEHRHFLHQDDLHRGAINFLKTGLLYANALTTVSPTYAREIQTAEYGSGLEDILRHRKERLFGILNGVDYDEWSPENDPHIPHPFTVDDLSGKQKNKKALLRSVGLGYSSTIPVMGVVSRLTGQKGFELLEETLPALLRNHDFRVVVLGSGERRYEDFFRKLERTFPEKVHFHNGFSNELAHRIEAGSDMFLMPSRYEPCGLNQMYSLRYGTVPVVRRTGGLADTVQIYDPDTGKGNGVIFDHFSAEGMHWAMKAALDLYKDSTVWEQIMRNGMKADYSWDRQGALYVELYRRLLETPL